MTARPLTVATVYNRYLSRGGEDEAFEAEADLLERHGVRVVPITAQVTTPATRLDGLRLGIETTWSAKWYRAITELIRAWDVDLIHFHNHFPVISPSALYAGTRAGIPVIQTLHNYRLICPSANLFRDGHTCEDCVGRLPWPGITHRCYHGSAARTTAIAAMLSVHRLLRTWAKRVDGFIALTNFARTKFIHGGLPPDKLFVKPNFVDPDPGMRTELGRHALFVGRISEEKGMGTLLEAWKDLDVPLRIIGDGPLVAELRKIGPGGVIEYGGRRTRMEVYAEMKRARFLVFPSSVYETFSLTLVEAFATGLPVIAPSHGAARELVDDRRTGLHFTAGDPRDLRAKVKYAWENSTELEAFGREGRREFEARYTADQNFQSLMAIYESVMRSSRARPIGASGIEGRRAAS